MDGVTILLARALEAGLEVSVSGDRLVVRGPQTLEPLARALLANKADVVRLLAPDLGASELQDAVRIRIRDEHGHQHDPRPVEGKRYLYRCDCNESPGVPDCEGLDSDRDDDHDRLRDHDDDGRLDGLAAAQAITAALALDGPGWICIHSRMLGQDVVFIRDTGVTVPPEHADLVTYTRAELSEVVAQRVGAEDLQRVHVAKHIFRDGNRDARIGRPDPSPADQNSDSNSSGAASTDAATSSGVAGGHIHAPHPVSGTRYLYRCECGDEFDTTPGPLPQFADMPPTHTCRRCRGYGWRWDKTEWVCLHCGAAA